MTISDLPSELLLEIFKYLDVESLLRCEKVCRCWRCLARDLNVWNHLPIVYSKQGNHKWRAEKSLQIITTHCSCIRHIKFKYVDYPEIITVLQLCINVTKLEISMCKVPLEFVEDLQMWPNLKLLHFPTCLKNTDTCMDFKFDRHKQLTSLNLPFFALNPTNFDGLLKCKHLCHMFLSKVEWFSQKEVTRLLAARRDIIRSFQIYGGNSIDDSVLKLISECKFLQNLAIVHCDNLTDDGLFFIKSLEKLEFLNIWNNKKFTEKGILQVMSNPVFFKVKHLSFSRIQQLSPAVVDIISKNYILLQFLAIYQCPLITGTEYEEILKVKFPLILLT